MGHHGVFLNDNSQNIQILTLVLFFILQQKMSFKCRLLRLVIYNTLLSFNLI